MKPKSVFGWLSLFCIGAFVSYKIYDWVQTERHLQRSENDQSQAFDCYDAAVQAQHQWAHEENLGRQSATAQKLDHFQKALVAADSLNIPALGTSRPFDVELVKAITDWRSAAHDVTSFEMDDLGHFLTDTARRDKVTYKMQAVDAAIEKCRTTLVAWEELNEMTRKVEGH